MDVLHTDVAFIALVLALIVYISIILYSDSNFRHINGVLKYIKQKVNAKDTGENSAVSLSLITQNNQTLKEKIKNVRKKIKNKFKNIQIRRLYTDSYIQSKTRYFGNDISRVRSKTQNPMNVNSSLRIKSQNFLKKNTRIWGIPQNLMKINTILQNGTLHPKGNNSSSKSKTLNIGFKYSNDIKTTRTQESIQKFLIKSTKQQKNRNFSYICPRFVGRLGNALFQYASTYGIAEAKGMKIGISQKDQIAEVFDIPLLPVEDSQVCLHAKPLYNQESKMCSFSERVYRFSNKSDVSVKSENYLQSWKYFKNVESVIRKNLKFKTSIKEESISRLKNVTEHKSGYKENNTVLIGIHVRRGDYLGRFTTGYLVATKEYIIRSLNLFRTLFENRLFLVFTEDITESMKWCRQHIVGDDIIFMFENWRTAASDLCLLSMCNHTIMTVGTYGWWGAWLANGLTVYAKDFATPGSGLRAHFSTDGLDYYLPEWIGL